MDRETATAQFLEVVKSADVAPEKSGRLATPEAVETIAHSFASCIREGDLEGDCAKALSAFPDREERNGCISYQMNFWVDAQPNYPKGTQIAIAVMVDSQSRRVTFAKCMYYNLD
jgi:hypothetical protein